MAHGVSSPVCVAFANAVWTQWPGRIATPDQLAARTSDRPPPLHAFRGGRKAEGRRTTAKRKDRRSNKPVASKQANGQRADCQYARASPHGWGHRRLPGMYVNRRDPGNTYHHRYHGVSSLFVSRLKGGRWRWAEKGQGTTFGPSIARTFRCIIGYTPSPGCAVTLRLSSTGEALSWAWATCDRSASAVGREASGWRLTLMDRGSSGPPSSVMRSKIWDPPSVLSRPASAISLKCNLRMWKPPK